MRKFLLGLVCTWFLAWSAAAAAAPGQIIDTAEMEAAIARGAIVWDVRGGGAYRKGHIPGAVNAGNAAQVLRNPNTEDYLPLEKIEAILGGAGIDPAKEIVVYSTRGNPGAYFAHFTLRYFGADKARVYHEGIDGWRATGKALATEATKLAPVALKLAPRPELVASTEEVVAAAKGGEVQLVDARTLAEHTGNDIRAIRGGHIPGALAIPYEENWVDPETAAKVKKKLVKDNSGAALKQAGALKALYAKLDPDKETIVYCQSGVRAAETATVLGSLGFSKVKVYDASWLGYAARLDAPANNEVFVNVGALRGEIRGLNARLDKMEAMLAKALEKR